MTAVGGSIESISIKGRIFPVIADNDLKRKLGGFSNKIEMNGDGSGRIIKMREPWSFEDLTLECSDTRGDQEYLKAIADGLDYVPCLITLADGANYSGKGIITDQPEFSSQNATVKISLSGPGEAKKQ